MCEVKNTSEIHCCSTQSVEPSLSEGVKYGIHIVATVSYAVLSPKAVPNYYLCMFLYWGGRGSSPLTNAVVKQASTFTISQ